MHSTEGTRKEGLMALALVLLSVTAITQAQQVGCGDNITSSLVLDADLTCQGSALTVGADSVIIDCDGHAIRYAANESGHAISASAVFGIAVKNCILTEGSDLPDAAAVSMYNVGSASIVNNTITTSGAGSDAILAETVFKSTFINNSIRVANASGISAFSSFFLEIENNSISSGTAYRGGVFLVAGGVVSLVSNRIDVRDGYGFGVVLMNLTGASFPDPDNPDVMRYYNLSRVADNGVIMGGDSSTGIYVSGSSVEAVGNAIRMDGANSIGLYAESVSENTFGSNSISASGNFSYGISLKSSDRSAIIENNITVSGESSYGVSSISGVGNIFSGNSVRSLANGSFPVLATSSLSERFEGNNLSNGDSGFSMMLVDSTDAWLVDNRLSNVSMYDGNATFLGNAFIGGVPKVVTLNVTNIVLSNASMGNDWGRSSAPFFVRGEDVDDERFADMYSLSLSLGENETGTAPSTGAGVDLGLIAQILIGLVILIAIVAVAMRLYKHRREGAGPQQERLENERTTRPSQEQQEKAAGPQERKEG